jgi:hypothetical protein
MTPGFPPDAPAGGLLDRDALAELVEQYRAGIEAELNLLRQLAVIAERQRSVTDEGNLTAFGDAADGRDEIMRSLVMLEENLRGIRQSLTAQRDQAARVDGFDAVVALHREAAHLVGTILSTDQASLSALADAELARRSVVASLERGETTLAAYRRVLAPPVASASLVNRRG